MNNEVFEKMGEIGEDEMFLYTVEDEDVRVQREPITKLRRLARDKNLFHVVGLCARAGVAEFVQKLEHEHYPPSDKARNDLLQTRQLKWKGHHWMLLSVPFNERNRCYDMARQVKMKFEKEGAYPMVVNSRVVLTSKSRGLVVARFAEVFPDKLTIDEFPLRSGQMVVLICDPNSATYMGLGGRQDDQASEEFRLNQYYKDKGIKR